MRVGFAARKSTERLTEADVARALGPGGKRANLSFDGRQ
jgi:hypothetical protein